MHGPFLSDVVVSDSDLCETLSQAPAFGIVCKFGGLVFLIHLHLKRERRENERKSLISGECEDDRSVRMVLSLIKLSLSLVVALKYCALCSLIIEISRRNASHTCGKTGPMRRHFE